MLYSNVKAYAVRKNSKFVPSRGLAAGSAIYATVLYILSGTREYIVYYYYVCYGLYNVFYACARLD